MLIHRCMLFYSALSIPRFFPAEKLLRAKGFSGNYPRPGSYDLTTMYREGYRVLLTLLQFFATKFLFLALHLESGERLLSRSPLFVLILSAVYPFAAGRISDFSGWFCGAIRFFLL